MNYSVEYYETEDGKKPAEEFILSQDKKMRAKIYLMLRLLENNGPALREPFSKSLGDGIFEARDLTQKQLAEATGIAQADISRLENGTANPSLRTLKRLAAGMGMTLKLEFVPIPSARQ